MFILNKNIKLNSFTHWNFLSLLYCIYYNNFYNFYCITTCWSWSIFITFQSGYFYDNTAYIKIRKKINCNFLEFHIGNFVLHILPCIYVYNNPPIIQLNYYHSFIALLLKISWIYISTNGNMDLSSIYIKLNNNCIKKLYLTSISSCLSVPFFYKILL